MIEGINIMEEDWDYLVVLDACRYDYFSKICREYFTGRLEKVISPASSTSEWCRKSFLKLYDDVVYFSANPYINSKVEIRGFNAKKHFHEIIDVWNWGWRDELGTVHPEQVNEAVLTSKNNYPGKRFIIHYLQPHEPYLGYKLSTAGFPRPQISDGELHGPHGFQDLSEKSPTMPKVLRWGLYSLDKLARVLAKGNGPLGGNPSWRVREILNLPPVNPMDSIRRKNGKRGLRQAYIENLRLVLKYVATLVQDLSGLIIITSDHGERLGEWGRFSHFDGVSDPLLLEIPWFRVEKALPRKNYQNVENRQEPLRDSSKEEEKRIKERLRSLGYI